MAINAGSVYAELVLDTSKYEKALNNAKKQTDDLAKRLEKTGENIEKAGNKLSKYVTAPILGAGAAATKLGMDFEAAMSEVAAISGATGGELAKLEAKAREMGATTKFSASDAAAALKYMAMAGWDTSQMLDGLEGVMMLAAASGEDLALTSDIVTDALTAFGMKASQAAEFADLLASASSNSNTNVAMLGESFKYVAPLFGALGYSAEDAALALGLMANAGIKGSQAGTSLRAAITNLANPTKSMKKAMDKLGISITDANGKMLPFKDVMDQLREKFAGLTEEQKAQYAATIFGKEAMSGMLAIINASEEDYNKLIKATKNYNGAAKEMSDIMQDNLKGRWQEFKSVLEETALQIYDAMLPSLERLLEKIRGLVEWFKNLNPETQETIVKMAALAAAGGPVLSFSGKLIKGISTAVGWMEKLSGATQASTTVVASLGNAAAIGTGKVTGLGLAAKAGAVLMNPWTVGLAAAGTVAYGLYKYLQEDTIPAVDLFADKIEYTTTTIEDGASRTEIAVEKVVTKISEATKEAVGAYLELDEEAKKHLDSLYINSVTITDDIKNELEAKYSEMASNILEGISKKREEDLNRLNDFFKERINITEREQQEIYKKTVNHYKSLEYETEWHELRIKQILENAAKEKRELTEEEMKEINRIQNKMKENAVKILSEQEIESNIILERMKENSTRITAEQASEHIKQVNRARDEAVKAANEEYEERLALIIRLRDEAGVITEGQANRLIQEAQRQRDETIKAAEETRLKTIDKMRGLYTELDNMVDTTTGEILTRWDKLKRWWSGWKPETKVAKVTTIYEEIDNRRTQKVVARPYAEGTDFHPGGLALVGEKGPELIELPRGSKVYTADETRSILGMSEEKLVNAFIKALKTAGLSKPAIMKLDGREVGRGIVNIIDAELHSYSIEEAIGRGQLTW